MRLFYFCTLEIQLFSLLLITTFYDFKKLALVICKKTKKCCKSKNV